MKNTITKKRLLLSSGALLLGASFVLQHYFGMSDFLDGLLKGTAIGLLFLSLVLTSRERANSSGH